MSLALGRTFRICHISILAAILGACFGFGSVHVSANEFSETMLSLKRESVPGCYSGTSYYFTSSDADFQAYPHRYPQGAYIQVRGETWFNLTFLSPSTLTNGLYLFAEQTFPSPSGHPGLEMSIGSSGCSKTAGEFYVKQITFDEQHNVISFWALFKQLCDGMSPPTYGEVRYNADTSVTVIAPFEESVRQGRTLSFEVSAAGRASNHVTLLALGLPAGASFVDHGNNTGTFTWTPTLAEKGWFTVLFQGQDETGHIDRSPTRIHVTGMTGLRIYAYEGHESYLSDTNALFYFYDHPYLPEDRINLRVYNAQQYWTLDFAAPLNQPLITGIYTNTTSVRTRDTSHPSMEVYERSWGLSANGWFAVKEIEYGPYNTLESVRIIFEQRSPYSASSVLGELRYNAHVEVDLQAPMAVSATNGALLKFDVIATDMRGHPVALTASNLPYGARFTNQGNNRGTIAWTPKANQLGDTVVQFQADNGHGIRESARTYITVKWLNHPPIARVSGSQAGIVGRPVSFDATRSYDSDDEKLSYHWQFGDVAATGGPRSTHSYRYPGIYDVTVTVRDQESSSQAHHPVTIGTCDGLDLALSLVQARWLPGSRGGIRTLEAIFRLRNQGLKNSTNPGLTFRTLSPSQGYVAPLAVRVGPLAAGYERLLHIRVPIFLRNNAAVKFPEIIALVSPGSNQRDCFPSNNQVRVRPKPQPEHPLNPGYGSETVSVTTTMIGNIPPPVFVADTNGVPEIPPLGRRSCVRTVN